MGKRDTPDDWGLLGDPPSEVQVTFLPSPQGPAPRKRIARIPRLASVAAIIALVLVVTAIGGVLVGASMGGRGAAVRTAPPLAHQRGPAGVAAAYGYPLRCLSVTISSGYPAYARADFNRALQCGRYHGYATAIFHRAGGAWRPVLDTIAYSCPVGSLPAAVQADLAVCP